MDSFEFNKIAAAVLVTALLFIGIKEIGNFIYHVDKPKKSAYKIEGVKENSVAAKKEIKVGDKIIFFSVEQHLVDRIIYGLDDIDITLKEKNKILNFEKARAIEEPWVFK